MKIAISSKRIGNCIPKMFSSQNVIKHKDIIQDVMEITAFKHMNQLIKTFRITRNFQPSVFGAS